MLPSPPAANRLLAALPAEVLARLTPMLSWVEIAQEACLYRAGDRLDALYFPTSLVVALIALGRSGASTALALIGREGGLGLMEALAGEPLPHDGVALLPGGAWRLPVGEAAQVFTPGSALLAATLNYSHNLTAQIAQTAFCNLHHSLDQRLCRWLLSIAYRRSEREMQLTEAQIADVLGVRRESVSQATVRLQDEGLIRHHRGVVEILDRDSLEAKACECLPVFPWQAYPVTCVIPGASGGRVHVAQE